MDIEEIVNSQAFKAINMLIDQKVKEMNDWADRVRWRVNRAFEENGTIGIRTYEERVAEGDPYKDHEIPFLFHEFKEIDYGYQEVIRLHKEIGELQQFKLRLQDDYDFTHGDNTEQAALFGVPHAESK